MALLLTFICFPVLPGTHGLATSQRAMFFETISTSGPIGVVIGVLLGMCSTRLSRKNQRVALRMWIYYVGWTCAGMLLGRLVVTLTLPSTDPAFLMRTASMDSPIVASLGALIAFLLALFLDLGRRAVKQHRSPKTRSADSTDTEVSRQTS